jgi:hypothetical protein
MKALDVCVVTASLSENVPLCTGAGFRLRVGIHDQIAAKKERGGFVFLLHDVVETECKPFLCTELRLNV